MCRTIHNWVMAMSILDKGYNHHVFISYSRSGDLPDWLNNHFVPVLTNRLEAILDEDPDIFVDKQIDVGSDWPETLAKALHYSSCLVAIWTPRYFRSKWCLAEWQSFSLREHILGYRTTINPHGLIYPVVLSGREYFPDEAKRIQSRIDLKDYAYPYSQFRNSEKYLEFHDKVGEIANDLCTILSGVPSWDSGWETVQPDLTPPYAPRFKRL